MKKHADASIIQADFDRLAAFSDERWDHNNHYHAFLLKHVPLFCKNALEVGCGTGAFARLLASHSHSVLAIDLSPQMIATAQKRSAQHTNIDFQLANVQSSEFLPEQFDCIVSIATLHHLPMEEILVKLKAALARNGTLIVLDLYQASYWDFFTIVPAMLVNPILKFWKTGRIKDPPAVRKAWDEHAQWDSYMTLAQLRRICERTLPGAKLKRHFFWRYSLIWRK